MGDEKRVAAGKEIGHVRLGLVPNSFTGIKDGNGGETVVYCQILRIFSGFPRKNSFVGEIGWDIDKFPPVSVYLRN